MINITAHSKNFVSRSLVAKEYGDYIITGTRGNSKSRHILWNCRCKKCGYECKTERYEITANRKSPKCPICNKKGVKRDE